GIVGEPPPEKLKVSVSFSHGYRAFGRLLVTGPDTLAKAEKVAELVWESTGGTDLFEDTCTQFLGWNGSHPSLTDSEPSEIIARGEAIYGWMVEHLTPAFVKERFAGICRGGVERHEVANLGACNFLLHESLGGGGTLSLLVDAQGKTYAQYLLAAEVEVPSAL